MGNRIEVKGAVGLERALEEEERRLHAGLVRVARNAAAYGRTKAMQIARAEGLRASGTYERSFVVGVTVTGATLTNSSEHAGIVEFGRTPGRRPPPVGVILQWMQDKGMVGRLPNLSVRGRVADMMREAKHDKRLTGADRRRLRGKAEESARQERLSKREKHIMDAWRRAWSIAMAIGRRGIRPRRVLGQTVPHIERFIRQEIRKLTRG